MALDCRAELPELGVTSILLADYHGAGNLTCVQVAWLGTPVGPTAEIGLAKGAFTGNPCIFKCIQVSGFRRQLMQSSNTSALPRSLRAGDLGYYGMSSC